MKRALLVFVIIVCILNTACQNPSDSSGNNKPEIKEISISPLPAKTDQWIYLTAVAIDKDGDDLTFYWSCSAGEFFPGDTDKNPTAWKVKTTGTHTITCTVSDGKDTSSKSISIDVT